MQTRQLNTKQLVQKCLLQNQAAQLEIYNRYYKAMYNVAFRILKNSQEAEDVMQDAFLKAFLKLESLQEAELFGGWLKKITVNLSIAALRKTNRLDCLPIEKVDFSISNLEQTEVFNVAKQKDVEAILEHISTLKNSYSVVLNLHYVEGFDYEEMAEILKLTEGNIRTLVSRAKVSLRKKMGVI